jgi:hypothetical protein
MISELKDEEILEFLMTSDFEEDYKPQELKYLLTKFRYFYRILYSANQNQKDDGNFVIKKLEEELEALKKSLLTTQKESADKQNTIDLIKSKKLSLKERITGKIIHKDEN